MAQIANKNLLPYGNDFYKLTCVLSFWEYESIVPGEITLFQAISSFQEDNALTHVEVKVDMLGKFSRDCGVVLRASRKYRCRLQSGKFHARFEYAYHLMTYLPMSSL